MVNFITGLIGATMAIIYLGYYAISRNLAALWGVGGGILFRVCADYYRSVRKRNQKSEK